MNNRVPDFERQEENYPTIPTSSSAQLFSRPHSLLPMQSQDDVMELLWQNGQVVAQRSLRRSLPLQSRLRNDAVLRDDQLQPELFMGEEEMASWLHYPLNDANFIDDVNVFSSHDLLLYPSVSSLTTTTTTTATAAAIESSHCPVLSHQDSAMVDSSLTPAAGRSSFGASSGGAMAVPAGVSGGDCTSNREMTLTSSSPGCSTASADPPLKPTVEDRKRKGKEEERDTEWQSEDVEFESMEAKKPARGSTSVKRSRAAEVHNLSERRRRDRINEKMRALQELIPRCNKSDKASMLDEAIEYLKSLQLQVQMMSMGCGMWPMMFPGAQQYMPSMGMGIRMSMEMGMNRQMMSFPNVLASAPLPTPAAAAHLGPRFPLPHFHMAHVPAPDPSSGQNPNQHQHQHQHQGFVDPYQQYVGLPQMQIPMPQNQSAIQPTNSRPRTYRGAENVDNKK